MTEAGQTIWCYFYFAIKYLDLTLNCPIKYTLNFNELAVDKFISWAIVKTFTPIYWGGSHL